MVGTGGWGLGRIAGTQIAVDHSCVLIFALGRREEAAVKRGRDEMSQTLLRNASLLDLDAACTRPGLSVLIEDERIVRQACASGPWMAG